mgnify:CR=1 FL=1
MDQQDSNIRLIAKPLLEKSAEKFGSTFFLSRLRQRGVEIIYVETPKNDQLSFLHPGLGFRPLHACSCAKAIAAFSNEAGIGTESMAHGTAITTEPVREGLVAMLGPMIDTLIVCSITGFIILSTGVWTNSDLNGISITSAAFNKGLPYFGQTILLIIVTIFSITTIIGYSYYGSKCAAFLFGNKWKKTYRIIYAFSLIPASIISIDIVINYVDGMFALMAIPTMVSTLILAPKVMLASKEYFSKLENKAI